MKNKGQIALFLNGEKPRELPSLDGYNAVFCTDGAYRLFDQVTLKPDLIIGDFDSIKELPNEIEHIHTPDQNFTDFEKALKIITSKGYTSVDVFGANGLEQDHFLGNMATALAYINKLKITFFDDRQTYFFIGQHFEGANLLGKKVSLFPFPQAENVVSTGLQFPLEGVTLSIIKNKLGIRNRAVEDNISVQFSKGNILLFINLLPDAK